MKISFRVPAILLSTSIAHAYIAEDGGRRKDSPFSTANWSPKSFAPKIRIRPLGEPVVREDKINVDSNADMIIRREYRAWTVRHGKVEDMKRFEIFKQNFVSQMEMNRKNGEFFLLNEFGDLTEEEYNFLLQKSREEIESSMIGTTKLGRVENFKEIHESIFESSRKAILQEPQIEAKAKKILLYKALADSPIQPDKYLSENIYNMLVDATRRTILHEKENMRSQQTNTVVFESTSFHEPYRDLLYTPMQQLDEFTLLPSLLSAAVSSVSETTTNHLISIMGSGLDDYTDEF